MKKLERYKRKYPELYKRAQEIVAQPSTLIDESQASDNASQKIFWLKWIWHHGKDILIADPTQLYGGVYKTPFLVPLSKRTATILTITNGINALTAWPILFVAVIDLPLGMGFILSTFINGGLFSIANVSGTLAAANTPDKKWTSRIGLWSLILTNSLLSVVGGVGPELVLNRNNLGEYFAEKITEQRVILPLKAEIKAKNSSPDAIQARQKCDGLEQALKGKTPNTPEYESPYSQAYGEYKDYQDYKKTGIYSAAPPSKWPWCVRADALEEGWAKEKEGLEQELKNIQKQVQESNSLVYLDKNLPFVYDRYFDDNGEIDSGVDAAAIALEVFFHKIWTGQAAELGVSLFFFVLSVGTSALAVLLILCYSHYRDVQMSWSRAVEEAHHRFFDKLLDDEESEEDDPSS